MTPERQQMVRAYVQGYIGAENEHIDQLVGWLKELLDACSAANKRVEELEKEVAKLREEPACDNTCVMIEAKLTAENKALASSIRERAAKICEDEAMKENEFLKGEEAYYYALGCTGCCNLIRQMEIP